MNILIIDTGSSSMRGSVLNEFATNLFTSSREYLMTTDSSGKCEMNSAIFHDALIEICQDASNFLKQSYMELAAIALTSQRSSVLPIDENGQPLSDIIMWHDKRSSHICDHFNSLGADQIYAICGNVITPTLSAPKILYIKNEMPSIYARTAKMLGIHDYLLLTMTGKYVTDTSLASRTGLLDMRKLDWSDELLDMFQIDKSKLCELVEPGSIIGSITPEFSKLTGLPCLSVISAGGDQQCSVLGQGLSKSDQAGTTVGTGSYVTMISKEPVFDNKRRVCLNASITPGHWVVEASTMASGSVYKWFNTTFYPDAQLPNIFEISDQDIQQVPPGSGQIIALPYLAGKGSPDWDSTATGTFFNFRLGHTRAEFARAILEGIASEISECVSVLNDFSKTGIRELTLCGGLTKFATFDQMIADMTTLAAKTPAVRETTVLGAWIAAVCTLGVFATHAEAIASLPFYKDCPKFECEPHASKLYARMNKARRLLYESIPFSKIAQILKEESEHEKKQS
jgi:sugar (pentulose or hexulose) kinase